MISRRKFCLNLAAIAPLMGCAAGEQPLFTDPQGIPPARNAPQPDFPDGLEIGHRLMDAGEFELALKAYRIAAYDMGLTVDVLSALGSAHLRLSRLGVAERFFRQALEKDDSFIPALNNLGVARDAKGELGEAREMFRVAYALDNGNSDEIRDNLRLLDAKLENFGRSVPEESDFRLVRRGNGQYLLLGQ